MHIYILSGRSSRDKSLLLEVLDDLLDSSCNIDLVGLDVDLGVGGRFVRCGDTGKVFDLSFPGLGVETLGVTLLDDGKGRIDVDLDEGDRGGMLLVQRSGEITVGLVRRDEGRKGEGAGEGEEEGDFAYSSDLRVSADTGWSGAGCRGKRRFDSGNR